MFSHVDIETSLRDCFDDGTCYAEIKIDVFEVAAWWMLGGKETRVVKFATWEKDLLEMGDLCSSWSVVGCLKEVRIIGLTLDEGRLMSEEHFEGDWYLRIAGVNNLISEQFGDGLIEIDFVLLNKL